MTEKSVPEHDAWRQHRNWLAGVPRDQAGFRGCMGLALSVSSTDPEAWVEIDDRRLLIPDHLVRWFTLLDVPEYRSRHNTAERPPSSWGIIRPTTFRYGMPHITGEGEARFDVAAAALDDTKLVEQRVFNHLNVAMTSFAFQRKPGWRDYRERFCQEVGLPTSGDVPLVIGHAKCEKLPFTATWMPQAYFGFRGDVRRLYEEAMPMVMGGPLFNHDLRACFIADLLEGFPYPAPFAGRVLSVSLNLLPEFNGMEHITMVLVAENGTRRNVHFSKCAQGLAKRGQRFTAGDVLGRDPVPLTLREGDGFWANWRLAAEYIGPLFPSFVRLWFDRQLLYLKPGVVHVPAALGALAFVRGREVNFPFWEVSRTLRFYAPDCDAFIFPPIPMPRWNAFQGSLCSVGYSVTPFDSRLDTGPPLKRRPRMTPAGSAA